MKVNIIEDFNIVDSLNGTGALLSLVAVAALGLEIKVFGITFEKKCF